MSDYEDGIVTGNCESENCPNKATSYDDMGNKLCDEHWDEQNQQQLREENETNQSD